MGIIQEPQRLLCITPMELVKINLGLSLDVSEKSIKFRSPLIFGSKEASARLKSTVQALIRYGLN